MVLAVNYFVEVVARLGIASPGTNRFHCHLIRVKNSHSPQRISFTVPVWVNVHMEYSTRPRPHSLTHKSNESSLAQSLPLRHSSTFGNADRIAPLYSENQTVNVGSVSPIGAKCEVCNGTVFKTGI